LLHHQWVGQEGAPKVVLLHSGGMSSRQWKRLAESLAPDYHVLLPDFLGSGGNPPWQDDEAFEFQQDVEGVAELLGKQPAHLVGHSYGGLIALTLARHTPQRVLSLAVYDPVTMGVLYNPTDAAGVEDLARVMDHPKFQDDTVGGTDEWLEVFIDYWNGPGSWHALPQASRQAFLQVGRKVYLEVRSLLADRTPVSSYTLLRAPALLLQGETSPTAARRVTELLAEALPKARLLRIEGAGHMGPITHASTVNAAIADHIRAASTTIG
jgi:pimeloyl-ACP methyl ester carboxylesterase